MAAEVTRAEIEQLIRKYATQFGVPLDLAMALAGSESSFNPQARGPVIPKTGRRALGLFQIYSEDVKKKYNITNPAAETCAHRPTLRYRERRQENGQKEYSHGQ